MQWYLSISIYLSYLLKLIDWREGKREDSCNSFVGVSASKSGTHFLLGGSVAFSSSGHPLFSAIHCRSWNRWLVGFGQLLMWQSTRTSGSFIWVGPTHFMGALTVQWGLLTNLSNGLRWSWWDCSKWDIYPRLSLSLCMHVYHQYQYLSLSISYQLFWHPPLDLMLHNLSPDM